MNKYSRKSRQHLLREALLRGALLPFLVLLLNSCSDPLTPVRPVWDVDAHVPLVSTTYTMEELLSEDSLLHVSGTGANVLLITQHFPMQPILFDDYLVLGDRQVRYEETFGAVHFEIPDYLDQSLDVFTLFPNLQSGTQIVAPQTSQLGLDVEIDAREYFEEVVFDEGRLGMNFTNNLPITLVINEIVLKNTYQQVLGTITPNRIVTPGETINLQGFDLGGLTLNSSMSLGFVVSTPGSGGQPVELLGSMGLGVRGELNNTDIRSITGYLPSQQLQYQHTIDCSEEGLRIDKGRVSTGAISFTVNNRFNIGAHLTFTVPEITVQGKAFKRSVYVGARTTEVMQISLAGNDVQPSGQHELNCFVDVVTDDATAQPVLVRKSDLINVTAALENVTFESMTGTMDARNVNMHDMVLSELQLSSRIEGEIEFSSARMWAAIDNASYLPIALDDAVVLGKSVKNGITSRLPITPVTVTAQSETLIPFADSEVVNFLNSFSPNYPDSIGINGNMVLNPESIAGTIHTGDAITGEIFVEIPMQFDKLDGFAVDTIEMMWDDDNRERMDAVNEGVFVFDIENHLPSSVVIEAEIMDASYRVLLEPRTAEGGLMMVGPAPVNGEGYVTRAIKTQFELHFTGENFEKFAVSKWIRFRLGFASDIGSRATFRTTDYIKVRGWAKVNVSSSIVE